MSHLVPYAALAILPLAFALGFSFNPIEFSWSFRHGIEPMPEGVAHKAAAIRRYANFLGDALIVGLVLILARKSSISVTRFGVNLHNWKMNCLIGVVAGGLLILAQLFVAKITRYHSSGSFAQRAQGGSVFLWAIIFVAGAFSEELWIAFCLVSFALTDHSPPFSVAMTTIVFGLVHYGYHFGGTIAVVLKGTISILLFLWCGSLVPTFLFHLIGNLGSLHWTRRR